jgi:large subunit ribosomal protein L10e
MTIRPAKCYKKIERPYTRRSAKKPKKGYVKGIPEPKIHRFESGNFEKKFDIAAALIAKQNVQIRDNALEAARVSTLKSLKGLTEQDYFIKIFPYPHHVLRENPMATGAGADRFQTGMRLSFGNPIGSAAQVKAGQKLIEIRTNCENEQIVKNALKVAASKLPTTCTISIKKLA